MKKIFTSSTILLIALALSTNLMAQSYSGGSGTSSDPYLISTTADLIELSNSPDDWHASFKQTANIAFDADETSVDWDGDGFADGSGTSGFSPIGYSTGGTTKTFIGSYHGHGHTISHLFINRPGTANVGLFGYTGYPNTATIDSLGLIDCNIIGKDQVGALVGINAKSTITECFSDGSVTGDNMVGGLVGWYYDDINASQINNCYSTVSVIGNSNVGGLVGGMNYYPSITNSYSSGSVPASGTDIGGLLGYNAPNNKWTYLIKKLFWNTETSGTTTGIGKDYSITADVTGKTTDEMKTVSTFTDAGWDFCPSGSTTGGIWTIDESVTSPDNDGYPALAWQGLTNNYIEQSVIATFPFFEDFEGGSFTPEIIGTSASESNATVSADAAHSSAYGVLLEGKSSTGWTGGGGTTTYDMAFNTNTEHIAELSLKVKPNLIETGALTMSFDMRQNYSFDLANEYFRVLVNGTTIADSKGDTVWNPSSASSDPWQDLVFDLSAFQSLESFDITIQNSGKYNLYYYGGGDAAMVDNLEIFYSAPIVATCQDITVQLEQNGFATITAADIDDESTVSIGTPILTVDISDFNCMNLGANTVTLTVSDESSNTGTCNSTVTVEDNVPPIMVCNAKEIVLYENGDYVLNLADIEELSAGTIDNCTAYEDLVITAFPRSFECVHVGSPVLVTLTATDASGNSASCATTVTVLDEIAPVAVCENVTVELDEDGKASIFPGQVNAGNNRASVPDWARTYNGLEDGSFDACGVESLNLDKSSFYCSDLGDNTVTLTATDPSGNTGTCQAVVTVVDNIVPTFEPIANITLEVEPGVCETEITYPEMVVNDNCEVTLTQTEGLGEDGLFLLGTTTETWTVTDDAGNTAELSFDVVITTTNAAPTVDKITDIEVEEDTYGIIVPVSGISGGNDCVAQDVTVEVSSTNPELVTSVSINYTSGDSASINLVFAAEMSGESKIIVTVTDTENDTIIAPFMVFVTAVNDAPFLVNPIEDQVVNASYPLTLQVPQTLGVLFDDIDDDVLTLMLVEEGETYLPAWASFIDNILTINPMIADTGCVNIVVTATDAAGASASDTFEVCVLGYPVSIGELGEGEFEVKIYPNPTRGKVNMDISSGIYDVELSVMDITGKVVFQKNYSASENITFDMSGKVSGMYFVKMNVDDNQIVKKLIVDRK